ncbi:5,6-dimethylbenzimidazole synthase [Shewanella violacea]|uniref:5,6-dimethylbenzimidazole synthase n=1 Tax=Shewanella violacea (strain JCM 10179 / CIP 106290 / LMG 19151 / DSS12) TaxID=637905 RepID=D4ZED7_SHEVD|nr:5,6-dimethylbenzimidazole synthase [Shewanella violacea]BAJ00167.1 nitroreductase family protein [Shewanella violacea DSS12]
MKITQAERDAVYKTIFNRRDVRAEFEATPIPDDVLKRILTAAHHAPSVGFMQPWDFVIVRSDETKQKLKQGFIQANREAEALFEGERKEQYRSLKLEGIQEAPIGICVTCDRTRTGPLVLGRTANLDMDLYSSVCAVQNLWLAARAENIGVGWVSIIHDHVLHQTLGIPEHIVPIAYLCLGYVSHFHDQPELEKRGWLKRQSLNSLIHEEQWQDKSHK